MPEKMKVQKEAQKAETTLFADPNNKILFVDNIHISANSEAIIFDFVQTLPLMNKAEDGTEYRQAAIVSRIAISPQHFKRFYSLCGKLLAEGESEKESEETK